MGRRSWIVTTGVGIVTAIALITEGTKRRLKSRKNQRNTLAEQLVHHHVRSDLEEMIRSVQHQNKHAADANHRLMISVRAALEIGGEAIEGQIVDLITFYQRTNPQINFVFDRGQKRIRIYS